MACTIGNCRPGCIQIAQQESRLKLDLQWVEASSLEEEAKVKSPELHAASWQKLRDANGILVPGGFGTRGVEGKILAAQYARTTKVWGGVGENFGMLRTQGRRRQRSPHSFTTIWAFHIM